MNEITEKTISDLEKFGSATLIAQQSGIHLVNHSTCPGYDDYVHSAKAGMNHLMKDMLWDMIENCNFPITIRRKEIDKSVDLDIGYLVLRVVVEKAG